MPPVRHVLVLGAVVALGAVLRLAALGSPGTIYFDETYYANDARVFLYGAEAYDRPLDPDPNSGPSQPPPSQGLRGEKSWVHPPLGKWLIACGQLVLGSGSPVGRRIMPALFGIGVVALVILMALELMAGSMGWAALAGLLAALDGLLIVESRISVLDSILAGLVCLGAWCVLRDGREERRRWYGTRWRLGAGLAFGAAVATKWSGVLALLVGLGITLAWTASQRRLRREGPGVVLAFVGLPMAVYLISYVVWFFQHGLDVSEFVELHRQMAGYHRGLRVTHSYQSHAIGWPILLRPVAYFYEDQGTTVRHIVALGNPALWWLFVPGFFFLGALAVRRAGWAERFTLAFVAAQYLPWLAVRRPLFLYYMTPVVPFMALGLTQAVRGLPGGVRQGAAGAVAVAAAMAAALLLPVWIGYGVPQSHWQRLMLFRSWI